MTIHYLHEMAANPYLNGWANRGMTLPEVEGLESRFNEGRPFPQAYREFLLLGGRFNNLEGMDTGSGYVWLQRAARERLLQDGQQLDRPFWVTDQLDACEQFGFIYLDDEQPDPTAYYCLPAYVKQGSPLVEVAPYQPFSRLITERVSLTRISGQHLSTGNEPFLQKGFQKGDFRKGKSQSKWKRKR